MKNAKIKAEIQLATGKTIEQLEISARSNLNCDGDPEQIKIKPGISIIWISNPNYGQGRQNGYGAGLYARFQMCGTASQSVRLTA